MDLSKGSDGFIFMSSLFNFMKLYATVKDTEEYWKSVYDEAEKLLQGFQNSEAKDLAECMVHGFLDYIESESRKNV